MSDKKKIAVIIPDGVGIKNYLYSKFTQHLKKNSTVILIHSVSDGAIKDIESIHGKSFKTYKLPEYKETIKQKFLRELIHLARLKQNKKQTKNPSLLTNWNPNKSGVNFLFYSCIELCQFIFVNRYNKILRLENLYERELFKSHDDCKELLKNIKVDTIINTHQRSIRAIPLISAAKGLHIRTYGAVFSWDNLPKARMSVRTDNYLLWSKHMLDEMLLYYPEVSRKNLHVTGTPQFEFYLQEELLESKEVFFNNYGLDTTKKTICFSGDDEKTSPFDPIYLDHIAEEISHMREDEKPQILLRRCPVDISKRFEKVVDKYPDIIKKVDPLWNFDKSENWTLIYPSFKDVKLLVNTVFHSDAVINVGSTMAHDFAMYKKPAIYLNYNPVVSEHWSIETIYKFQHFRSLDDLKPVYWLNSRTKISEVIQRAIDLEKSTEIISDSQKWLNIISTNRLNASKDIANLLSKTN